VFFIVTNGLEYDKQKQHLKQTCPSKQIQHCSSAEINIISQQHSVIPSQTAKRLV